MKMEKLNFPEAIKMLAQKAGVSLPVSEKQNSKNIQEKELIYRLNEIAADYYQKNLFLTQGKSALDYLLKRGFSKEIINKFELGYALPGFEHLVNVFLSKKITPAGLFKAGLASKSTKTNKTIDYFRNRIIFPIFNLQGNIIAFGGRVLDDKLPKYINSPETLVYQKSKNLYGFFQAKKSIRKQNQVIVMEGYTDVLMAHQFGVDNAVASLGTALTVQQISFVKRFADEMIVAFDADTAGQSATLRSLSLIKKAGIKVRVISLPANSDPADILLKKGKQFFINLIERALPLIDYKLKILIQQFNPATTEGKVSIIRELFQDLSAIDSNIELNNEVKKLAERLRLTEDSILKDLNRYKKGDRQLPRISTDSLVESTHINAEKILIGSMLQKKDQLEKILSELNVEDFSIPEHQEIISVIINLKKKGERISVQKVMDLIENPQIINLLSQIILKDLISLDSAALERSIRAIKTYNLTLELNTIKSEIEKDEKNKKEVTPAMLQKYQNILQKIKNMA